MEGSRQWSCREAFIEFRLPAIGFTLFYKIQLNYLQDMQEVLSNRDRVHTLIMLDEIEGQETYSQFSS